MASAFPTLFSPLEIGSRTIKNRICCSAHADSLAEDGMPTERTVRYYELKARGGIGFMMCFGSASVHRTSPARDWNGVELFEDRVIPHLVKFSETMHKYGVPCVAQITHRGRRGRSIDTWERMYAPSAIREPNHRETPRAMDAQTMKEFIRAFADAAGRLKEGGFDGCEVMASHCHLIDQFWTPNANQRGDDYGGELTNRIRFGIEVLHAVRERVGRDFIVGIRMTGDDFTDGGVDNVTAEEIAGRLNDLKLLDYFNIVAASAETYPGEAAAVPDMSFPLGVYAPVAAAVRAVVNVPVIAMGRINDPAVAERILQEGQADLCIMNRALIADPDFPNKAKEGRLDDIRQCMGYNQGCIDRIYTGRGVTCVQNAIIGRETIWAEMPRAASPKKVLIIGGGPAGLECARVARLRGHQVVLLERSQELGGQTLIARNGPARQDFDGACRFSALQCRKLGVDIRLGVTADASLVQRESPDVVVLATGARPFKPQIPGIDEYGYNAWEALQGTEVPGNSILVLDEEYGFQAPSVAEYLLDRGKQVDLVTSERAIGSFLGATTAPPVFRRLFSKGVRLHCNLKVVQLESNQATAKNVWSDQEEVLGPYDAFVYAYGGESVCDLEKELTGKAPRLELIGDCFAPRTLQHAILEGHKLAREL
ncbi:MAG TPA: FAD-dependent oxidoreductase [Gemmataceae bacterium]|jgi:2,4-dienoyl-CoA reductase-like NADH-dependent reductase (Old Yellow Enzyme family)